MLFNSYPFIFAFLPASICAYFIAGRFGGRRVAAATLALASLFFYGSWNPQSLWIFLTSILVNAGFIGAMLRVRNGHWPRRLFLICGLFFNLGLLGFFKYAKFATQTLNEVLGTHFIVTENELPLGISFFTFQKIAFLVDVYVGSEASFDFLYYCLFVSFFPPLIAGPIVHYRELVPQFKTAPLRPQLANFAVGLSIFAIGLFKKCVLADLSAGWANPVFDAASKHLSITSADAWVGTLAYTFQIYFDFSGYSDMAIGLARLFGFTLPLNFFSPYKAASIIDFWHRWHITLSRFLRDYLYIPLGGNRKGSMRRYANLVATMVLGGLWHGAAWAFVLWGGSHGAMLAINHGWRALCDRLGLSGGEWPAFRPIGWALTFVAVASAWVLFRADSTAAASAIIRAMYGLDGQPVLQQLSTYWDEQYRMVVEFNWSNSSSVWLSLTALTAFVLPNVAKLFELMRPTFVQTSARRTEVSAVTPWISWRPSWIWATVVPALFLVSVLRLRELSPFIYFQF
jgi:alginate O-acetyltransferase complex protein AlgI